MENNNPPLKKKSNERKSKSHGLMRLNHGKSNNRKSVSDNSLDSSDGKDQIRWNSTNKAFSPHLDSGSLADINHIRKRTLSAYAVHSDPRLAKDEWQIPSQDEEFDFFEKGREFQSRKQKHHFTNEEKEIMGTYESAALRPSHTAVYRDWLSRLPPRSDSESWIIISLIAIIIGILAFLMKTITDKMQIFSNPFIENFVKRGKTFRLWLYFCGMSCTFGAFSAIIITYICPSAGGSGTPEICGILNGCVVRNILGMKTLVCKIISCVFTVISGLPVGFEGPMIHIGAMVAALMARPFRCSSCQDHTYTIPPDPSPTWKSCKKRVRKVCRYRDCQERHNLICVGAAAGVASAFSSPITGLAFAMEEMSTHWTNSLTWQTFVTCILSRSTTELLHTIFGTVERKLTPDYDFNRFDIFQIGESALFDTKVNLQFSLSIFIPTLIIGLMGGFLGSLYIFMHLKMAKFRRKVLRKITRVEFSNAFKIMEVVMICFICASVVLISMQLFDCRVVNHTEPIAGEVDSRHMRLRTFNCKKRLVETVNITESVIYHVGEFHEGASLFFGSWEQMVRNLLSRRTPDFFGVFVLFFVFIFFFVFSSWAAMTSMASGLLIPQLAIGSLYGRLLGKIIYDLFRTQMEEGDIPAMWDFTDPGALALLGAASFFAGTSRLPITSVVMMAEMTNDINMSLFVMIVVMLSRFIGDMFTHSLVHSILEFKCVPVLEPDLKIYHRGGKRINLELFSVSDVMAYPVVTANLKASVYDLANMLLDTNHGSFPVVRSRKGKQGNLYMGNITRLELTILLTKTESFDINELKKEDIEKIRISYPEYSSNKLKDLVITNKILQTYSSDYRYSKVLVNLYPYINLSSHSVSFRFSLYRTYSLFRDLGLRHLVVVDDHNTVRGIVTRKDILGDVVEEKVKRIILRNKKKLLLKRQISESNIYLEPQNGSMSHRLNVVNVKLQPKLNEPSITQSVQVVNEF